MTQLLTINEFINGVLGGAVDDYREGDRGRSMLVVARRHEDFADGPLGDFIEATVERRRKASSPFACYLEAPTSITSLYQRHGERLATAARDFSQALEELLIDSLTDYFARMEAEVDWSELKSAGVSRRRPPEIMEH